MQDFSTDSTEDFFNTSSAKLENALYIVATPIGNMGDMSFRALQTLKQADFIICEDTRVTLKILRYYKIPEKKFITYNDHSSETDREKILNLLIQKHSIVLVSDAGTPLISDPGYKLVQFLKKYNQKIIPIPGASSPIAALCASGLACDNFLFLGFPPTSRIQQIDLLKSLPKNFTAIFFESANRVIKTLDNISKSLGNRRVCCARELTKLHEEIVTDEVEKVSEFFEKNPTKLRGEFVIIIEKMSRTQQKLTKEELVKEIKKAMAAGFSVKELSNNLAEIYDLNKKEIYHLALQITKE